MNQKLQSRLKAFRWISFILFLMLLVYEAIQYLHFGYGFLQVPLLFSIFALTAFPLSNNNDCKEWVFASVFLTIYQVINSIQCSATMSEPKRAIPYIVISWAYVVCFFVLSILGVKKSSKIKRTWFIPSILLLVSSVLFFLFPVPFYLAVPFGLYAVNLAYVLAIFFIGLIIRTNYLLSVETKDSNNKRNGNLRFVWIGSGIVFLVMGCYFFIQDASGMIYSKVKFGTVDHLVQTSTYAIWFCIIGVVLLIIQKKYNSNNKQSNPPSN